MSRGDAGWRAMTVAVLADLASVLIFVLVGRRSHGGDLAGFAATAAPFVLGLVAAWLVACLCWRPGSWRALSPRWGLVVWAVTLTGGLLVRAAFTGRLPWTFVLVAALSLGILQLGWRGVAWAVTRLRVMHS